jgi:branched-chain amino acid transport system substrate-binding protein
VAVIGPYSTTNAFAIKRDALLYRVPVITPGATNDMITERNPYVFRTCFTDSSQGKALASFAYNKKQYRKVAVLVDLEEDGDYSKGLGRSFLQAFEKLGGKVVVNSGYHRDQMAFSGLVEKSMKAGADSIFVPGYPNEAEAIIMAALTVGFKGRLFGGDGWDAPEILTKSGPNAAGCFFSAMFYPDMKRKNAKEFVELFIRKEKVVPGSAAAQGYDTAGIVLKALEYGFTPEDLRKGLLAIKNYDGVTGKISMNKEGNVKKDIYIKGIYKSETGSLKEKLLGIVAN